jgi:hypothetical protein
MDLRKYYQEVNAIAEAIPEAFPLVVSLATEDGGVAGRTTQVSKQDAAQLIHGKRGRLATEEETKAFQALHLRLEEREKQEAAEQLALRLLKDAGLHRALREAALAREDDEEEIEAED